MRSLDEFYKYIEKQEKALREASTEALPRRDDEAPAPVAPPDHAAPVSDAADAPPPTAAATPFVPPPRPPRPARPGSRYDAVLPSDATPLPRRADSAAAKNDADAAAAADPTRRDVRYLMRGGVTVPAPGAPKGTPEADGAGESDVPDLGAYIPALREEPRARPAESTPPAVVAAAEDDVPTDYLPPIVEGNEPPQVADAPTRAGGSGRAHRPRRTDAGKSGSVGVSDQEAAALWGRLPRHIQLLVEMAGREGEEVAQKYYTRGFKETRRELIERLLDPTLTLEDTARVLGVCPTTVRRYTNRGVLPHHRTVGQQRRFRLSDVLAYLERSAAASRRQGTDNDDA